MPDPSSARDPSEGAERRGGPRADRHAPAGPRGGRLLLALLVAGALTTGAATTTMAVHRLQGDGDGGQRGAGTRRAAASVRPPARSAPLPAVDGPLTREQETASLARLAAIGRPVFCAGSGKRLVALTFDGGPVPATHEVLRRLQRNRMRATFFVAGDRVAGGRALVAQASRQGAVGLKAPAAGPAPAPALAAARRTVATAAAHPVTLVRPPSLRPDPALAAAARRLGLVQVQWSTEAGDDPGVGAATIRRRVLAGLGPGAIVRLHDTRGQTVRALPGILHELHRRGLRAVSVPVLLTADPPTPAELRAGRAGCGARRAGR